MCASTLSINSVPRFFPQEGTRQEAKERNSYIPPSNYVRPDKMFTYSISRTSVFEDAQYAEEISPIVLACQLERVEIVNLLFTKCKPDIHPLSGEGTRMHAHPRTHTHTSTLRSGNTAHMHTYTHSLCEGTRMHAHLKVHARMRIHTPVPM